MSAPQHTAWDEDHARIRVEHVISASFAHLHARFASVRERGLRQLIRLVRICVESSLEQQALLSLATGSRAHPIAAHVVHCILGRGRVPCVCMCVGISSVGVWGCCDMWCIWCEVGV